MNLAASDIEVESSLLRHRTRPGRLRCPECGQLLRSGPPGPDSDKVVDRARTGRDAKLFSEGNGDPSVRPAPLAKPADQVRIGLKLALGRPVIGLGEEICDLVIEVHAPADTSTVWLSSGPFGGYSGKFGHVRRLFAARAEWTRIYPNSVRLCSALFGAAQAALDILRLQK